MNQTLPTLETERLILRPCTKEDVEELHAIYWKTVPDIMAYSEKAHRPTLQDIRDENEYYLSFSKYSFLRPFGRVMVALKNERKNIGTCLLIPHVFTQEEILLCADSQSGLTRFGTLEVIMGCALTKPYRGNGYGTEAARALIDYGLNTLKLQRILAETTPDNQASIQIMKKVGMQIISSPNANQVIGMIER
jgi:[ribosomal protein S5]-alanine N-acetyltransferase